MNLLTRCLRACVCVWDWLGSQASCGTVNFIPNHQSTDLFLPPRETCCLNPAAAATCCVTMCFHIYFPVYTVALLYQGIYAQVLYRLARNQLNKGLNWQLSWRGNELQYCSRPQGVLGRIQILPSTLCISFSRFAVIVTESLWWINPSYLFQSSLLFPTRVLNKILNS